MTLSFEIRALEKASDKIHTEISRIRENLAQSPAETYAEYREQCGVHRGLRLALELLSETEKEVSR